MTQKSLSSAVAIALFLTPLWLSTPSLAQGIVKPEEMAEARRWVQAKFEGVAAEPQRQIGLNVVTSYGSIDRNAHGELPLKLQEKIYKRGLYCHAPSKIVLGVRPVIGTKRVDCRLESRKFVSAYYRPDTKVLPRLRNRLS